MHCAPLSGVSGQLADLVGLEVLARRTGTAERYVRTGQLSRRVTFAVTDASGPGISGRIDLVTILEGLHDMPRQADALRTARRLLRPSGSVVIADELTADMFTAPASDLERYHYGWSVVSCLPSGAQGSGGGASPVRNASTSCGSHRPARTISIPLNAR